ncbi:tetratricopeptide repeat protein [Microcoleus sp. FACHB-SPT15]|uniref:tetratricopeptide repeat protein n=1 Tax=Microcoleus sp. FACHB-SPT15 TaxID=2692830 RepID=UPI0017864CA8|nr:tetratricopeptide repeat protein [Microcoleus sp. FACHB-SPT15]MBD1808124.1 tetratricopeptide repeat protein [Microcoleus sp. FACHB-SPT15]
MPVASSRVGLDFTDYVNPRIQNFTGRQWVFEKIHDWLSDPNGSRYFLLTGEPGSGKTAIAGQVYQHRLNQQAISKNVSSNFPNAAHFCSASRSTWVDPKNFSESIALQLSQISEYAEVLLNIGEKEVNIRVEQNLGTVKDSTVQGVVINNLDVSGLRSGQEAFNRVVLDPLNTIYGNGFDKPITILVDSLDEALTFEGEKTIVDLLSAVQDLPEQVRFLLTSRPKIEALEPLQDRAVVYSLTMGEGLQHSQEDVNQYVWQALKQQPELVAQLAPDLPQGSFVTTVSTKSDGNFLYVTYLLKMLAQGHLEITKTTLEQLPDGLDGIYREFLYRLVGKDKSTWRSQYAPVLGTLAITQEALTREQLAGFTQMSKSEVAGVLGELQQFLEDESLPASQRTYAIYHRSLANFLQDEDRAGSYWCDAQEQHQRIVNYYRAGAKSWLERDWTSIKDDYAFRYLPYHLKQAGQHQELCKLLTSAANWMQAKFIHYGSDEGYVTDLQLALNAFTNPGVPEQIAQLVQLHTARQVIYHRASRYNDTDLKTLVWLGGEAQAIQHARLRPSASQRFDSVWAIYNTQRAKGQPPNSALLREMWEQAQLIDSEETRIAALGKIATALSQIGHLPEITAIITETTQTLKGLQTRYIKDAIESIHLVVLHSSSRELDRTKLEPFREFVTVLLQLRLFTEAEEVAQAITDNFERVNALTRLAVALAQAGQFAKAEKLIKTIEWDLERLYALKVLAIALAQAGQFAKAEQIASTIQENPIQAEAFSQLAIALAQAGQFAKAEQIASTIQENPIQAEAFSQLAIALAQAGQFPKAKKLISNVHSSEHQVEALSQLATALIKEEQQSEAIKAFAEAREIAQIIENYKNKIEALIKLATALAHVEQKPEAVEAFAEARETAQVIENSKERDNVLCQLAIALAEVQYFTEAEQVAQTVEDYRHRAETLRQLAVALVQAGKQTDALTSFTGAGEIDKALESSRSLTKALRQLSFALIQGGQFSKAEEVALATLAIENDPSRILTFNDGEIAQNSKSDVVLRQVARTLAEVGQFVEAEQAALAISFRESRSEALKELVLALARTEQFSEAKRLTQSIEAIGSRTSALKELVNALVRIGQFTEAEQLARSIQVPRSRALALKGLASALAQAGRFTDAEQVAEAIDDSKIQSETVTDLLKIRQTVEAEKGLTESSNVAQNIKLEKKQLDVLEHSPVTATQAMNFEEALVATGLLELNEFLSVLSEWAPAFEKVKSGLSVTVLSEAVRIAGWVHPDWRKISELLNTQAG